jgi:hypothetical protein
LTKPIDLRAAITLENLALAGGFDSLRNTTRRIFHDDGDGITFLQKRFVMVQSSGKRVRLKSKDLFGDASGTSAEELPPCRLETQWKKLSREKRRL